MAAAAITAAAVIAAVRFELPQQAALHRGGHDDRDAERCARLRTLHACSRGAELSRPHRREQQRAVISAMEHVSNSRAQTAQTACERVNGGTPGTSEGAPHDRANAAAILAFARCMRRHGFASFPDPTASGQLNHEMLATAGIDLHQPALVQSADTCVSVTHGAITKVTVARFIAAQ